MASNESSATLKRKSKQSKTALSALSLCFDGSKPLVECFTTLFRTVPPYRFNNCFLFHDTDTSVEGVRNIIKIASQDEAKLKKVQSVLLGAPEFQAALFSPDMTILPYEPTGEVLGSISGGEIKIGNSPSEAKQGAYLALSKAPIVSAHPFDPEPCPSCGRDTEGQSYCQGCNKQIKHISAIAYAFLFVLVFSSIYNLATRFRLEWITAGDTGTLLWSLLTIAQFLMLLGSAFLLIRYRKVGFRVLILLKLLDMLLYFYIYGFASAAAIIAASLGL